MALTDANRTNMGCIQTRTAGPFWPVTWTLCVPHSMQAPKKEALGQSITKRFRTAVRTAQIAVGGSQSFKGGLSTRSFVIPLYYFARTMRDLLTYAISGYLHLEALKSGTALKHIEHYARTSKFGSLFLEKTDVVGNSN